MTVRATLLWGTLCVVLLVASYLGYKKYFEWVEVEVEGPMSVQARKHDLLAASRYLNSLGFDTDRIDSSDFFAQLPPVTDTILLQTVPDTLPDAAYTRLLGWVKQGGHLLIGLSGDNEGDAVDEFFESLGITHTREFERLPQTASTTPTLAAQKNTHSDSSYKFSVDGLESSDPVTIEMLSLIHI